MAKKESNALTGYWDQLDVLEKDLRDFAEGKISAKYIEQAAERIALAKSCLEEAIQKESTRDEF